VGETWNQSVEIWQLLQEWFPGAVSGSESFPGRPFASGNPSETPQERLTVSEGLPDAKGLDTVVAS